MTTLAQVTANRANAAKSCGPTTSEGRAASALNARKHGVRSASAALLPSESREEWEELLSELRNDLKPEGAVEDLLVERVAAAEWRRRRAEHFELGALIMEGAAEDGVGTAAWRDNMKGQGLGLAVRYRRASDAAYYQALHELERRQQRRSLPPGATMPAPMVVDVAVTGISSDAAEE